MASITAEKIEGEGEFGSGKLEYYFEKHSNPR
jgi:hypothetical protein